MSASVAQLVTFGNIRDLWVVDPSTDGRAHASVISLGQELARNCFSRLMSINEYLSIDQGW